MSDLVEHGRRLAALADKVTSLAEDAVRDLELVIFAWPGEFRAIVWGAVAEIASRRASEARSEESK